MSLHVALRCLVASSNRGEKVGRDGESGAARGGTRAPPRDVMQRHSPHAHVVLLRLLRLRRRLRRRVELVAYRGAEHGHVELALVHVLGAAVRRERLGQLLGGGGGVGQLEAQLWSSPQPLPSQCTPLATRTFV
jgi:hypothetical protein